MSSPYTTPEHQESGDALSVRVRAVSVLKIITVALSAGILVFMGIALGINAGAIDGEPKLLSWIGLGMAVLMFVNHLIVPNIIASLALNKINLDELRNADEAAQFLLLFPSFQTRHIVACAMLESAAFFNLIAYMIEKSAGSLATASVLLVLILIRFPTVSSVEFWIQDRAREVDRP